MKDLALKAISIISFILIILALILIRSAPATGYELSIYTSVPPLVWVFLIIAIAGGVYIIVYQAFSKKGQGNWWLIGFFILMLANFILTSLPSLKGYLTGRADILSHIGYEVDIISSGHISQGNFYPIVHILTTQIALICDISAVTVMNYLTGLFTVLCMVYIYLLATAVLPNRSWVLVATASSAVLLYLNDNVYARPSALSYLMLPLILFLYFRATGPETSLAFKAVFTISLFLYPFLHPFPIVILILSFIVLELSKAIYVRIANRRRPGEARLPLPRVSLNPPLLASAVFLTWLMSFAYFRAPVYAIASWLRGEAFANPTGQMLATLGKLELSTLENLELTFKIVGQQFIFLVLSLIAVAFIAKRAFSTPEKELRNLFMLAVWFVAMGLVIWIGFFSPGTSFMLGWDRPLKCTLAASTILVGFALYEIFRRVSRVSMVGVVAVVLIITASATVGILNLHRSPYIMQPTLQVTRMEMTGWEWFFEFKDSAIKTTSHLTPAFRFGHAILGLDTAEKRGDTPPVYAYEGMVPDHFNYTHYATLGESYTTDRYMVISQYDKSIYTEVWPMVGRFTEGDFERLTRDTTVAKLYSNGELEVWRITPAS